MSTATKIDPKKTAEEAKKKAEATASAAKEKLTNNPVTKAAGNIFGKIKAKTGLSNEKVDKWQKSWLSMPETRKKYEHLKDTPQVVGEELVGMSNDIIDFIQGEETGQSHVFKKLKAEFGAMFHDPLAFFKSKLAKGKEAAMTAKSKAQEGMNQAKSGMDKAKSVANQAKAKAGQAKEMAAKAKSVAGKAKSAAKKVKK